MKSFLKNLIFVLILGGAIYAGYVYFFAGNDAAMDSSYSNEGEVITREFLVRLGELEQIDFSRELFADPRFRSLSSFSTSPEPATAGRSNPFSP